MSVTIPASREAGVPVRTGPDTPAVGIFLSPLWGAGIRHALDEALADQVDIEIIEIPDEGEPARQPRILVTGPGMQAAAPPAWFAGVDWVHSVSAGVDSFPSWVLERHTVTCSRGIHATQISEWVIAALLTETRVDPWISAPVDRFQPPQGGLLAGSTLGIVGFGEIGQAVARKALALEIDVVAVRRRDRPSPVDGVQLLPDLPSLLAVSDAVLLSAASTPETHHLIDAAALARVKPGVHLLNIARGTLVDQDALRDALDGGQVRAASLDVTTPEPLPAGHWLFDHPRVRISPHVSGWSPRLERRIAERFRENLLRYRAGQPLVGLVDPVLGY
ncbi:NAD(P)-dependent oxidoreductase [Frankia sp. Cppng1_Ct_nod]|uniref:NAD(P)-dependent oxidoreductase n=1 Tax=Frankia sp. Cppng1_Ct_nod TaxID=2897162 RepID=UPI0020246430|nr:NAD(P)-dependent oxidoreductase [Frankia sp. Cppng1_Ct_nod]